MPNWVTNKISADPEIIASMVSEENKHEFDLDRIVPMPEILRCTRTGSNTFTVDGKEEKHRVWYSPPSNSPFTNDGCRPLTEDELKEIAATGHGDWYGWAVANWGTKWGTGGIDWDDGEAEAVFDTAWASPFEAMVALSKKFPKATIRVEYADEDWGNNCGWYVLRGGKAIEIVNDDTTPDRNWLDWAIRMKGAENYALEDDYYVIDENKEFVHNPNAV